MNENCGKNHQKMEFFLQVGNLKLKKFVVFLKIEQNGYQIRNQLEKVHIKSGRTFAISKKSSKSGQLIPHTYIVYIVYVYTCIVHIDG